MCTHLHASGIGGCSPAQTFACSRRLFSRRTSAQQGDFQVSGYVCMVAKLTLPIFWSCPKHWPLFGWLPSIWQANAFLVTIARFPCQCWPTHGQPKGQPKFWLAKYLVGLEPTYLSHLPFLLSFSLSLLLSW